MILDRGTRWSRAAAYALLALLVLHAALVVYAVGRQPPASIYNPVDTTALAQVGLISLSIAAALAFGMRRQPALAVGGALFATALALLSAGAVLCALFALTGALLLGDAILGWIAHARSDAPLDLELALLAGLSVTLAALAAVANLRLHFAPVYAIVPALMIAWRRDRVAALLQRVAVGLRPARPMKPVERGWLALLAAVIVLHLFVVARPDVGHDAQAMHLQFARLVAARHAWLPAVDRYVWALMPLGADWLFAVGYVLDGENCARTLNLAAGVMTCRLLYRLVGGEPGRWPALASVALFASAPIAFLLTGSLFAEGLLCAFLLGALLAALEWLRTRAPATLCAAIWCAAGAMQCKATALVFVAPLAAGLLLASRARAPRFAGWPLRLALLGATAAGAWPYLNAWWRTGNPVFPFMNGVFRSPLFTATSSFNNWLYNSPLRPSTPYDLVLDSSRFVETWPGATGVPGYHWLLLLPLVVVAFAVRRHPRAQWACVALGVFYFVAIYLQQSYLRYLLPALLVIAAAAGWALHDLPSRPTVRGLALALGAASIALNVRYMDAGSWFNADLCIRCAVDPAARAAYIRRYAALRQAADWLNERAPYARVGFFLNGPSPAGFLGYSRAWSWHDPVAYAPLTNASTADAVLGLARGWQLTHIVVAVEGTPLEMGMTAFRDRYTTPLWQAGNVRIALIAPPDATLPPGATLPPDATQPSAVAPR